MKNIRKDSNGKYFISHTKNYKTSRLGTFTNISTTIRVRDLMNLFQWNITYKNKPRFKKEITTIYSTRV